MATIQDDKYYKVKGSILMIMFELVGLYKDMNSIDAERRDFFIGQLANEFWYMDLEEI